MPFMEPIRYSGYSAKALVCNLQLKQAQWMHSWRYSITKVALIIRGLIFALETFGSQHHTQAESVSKLVGSLLLMYFIHLELKTEALSS